MSLSIIKNHLGTGKLNVIGTFLIVSMLQSIKMNKKEKNWLKEGIKWTPEKITFVMREENKLFCIRIQSTPVDNDPVEFMKKLGVVEDGIFQEDWDKVIKKINEENE